jgi:hypothetical protein
MKMAAPQQSVKETQSQGNVSIETSDSVTRFTRKQILASAVSLLSDSACFLIAGWLYFIISTRGLL